MFATIIVTAAAVLGGPSTSVVLQNAADPNVVMPGAGLGTGCAIGGCKIGPGSDMTSLNMTKTWLAMGGRRIDAADSYGCEPGIGLAWKQSGLKRSEVFFESKTGPGGLAWPLGYNETIEQARQIAANYSTTHVDLLLIHWPRNYGPCKYGGPKPSIPTTDPLCDTALTSYDEKGCRLSTWKAMLYVWQTLKLSRAIGVSNFNTTHLDEIKEAGLPMPSVNQVEFNPSHGLDAKPCTPSEHGVAGETCGALLDYCRANKIVFNGYTPYGGAGGAGKTLSDPRLVPIAKAHNVSTAQVVLAWQWAKGIPTNSEAVNPTYQHENLDIFSFTLSATEVAVLDNWNK